MVDAHGTFSVPEAKRFAAGVEPYDLRWFEEPVNADDRRGTGGGAGLDAHRRSRPGRASSPASTSAT